jgi:hypothetical protein
VAATVATVAQLVARVQFAVLRCASVSCASASSALPAESSGFAVCESAANDRDQCAVVAVVVVAAPVLCVGVVAVSVSCASVAVSPQLVLAVERFREE